MDILFRKTIEQCRQLGARGLQKPLGKPPGCADCLSV
jgi:hypothetical protein